MKTVEDELSDIGKEVEETQKSIVLKNHVFIIDEINRGNVSSILR